MSSCYLEVTTVKHHILSTQHKDRHNVIQTWSLVFRSGQWASGGVLPSEKVKANGPQSLSLTLSRSQIAFSDVNYVWLSMCYEHVTFFSCVVSVIRAKFLLRGEEGEPEA